MKKKQPGKDADMWFGEKIAPGESKNVTLAVGESYSGMTVKIQIHVRRGLKKGPVVFVTAALHGDEINGCGAIRQLIQNPDFELERGTLVLVPVLNLLAFDRHSRYLPDRRDLNRSFPGSVDGSLAGRMAHVIFNDLVMRCDYGIDLHTAAVRRTNYPTIRADLTDPIVRRIAESFGSEVIINSKGPKSSFRREASLAGCPTVVMEGGEVWKVEPGVSQTAFRGVKNILCDLKMINGDIKKPPYQIIIEKSKWIRADNGGFLDFHIQPGDLVEKGQPLATNTSILGDPQGTLLAPFDAVVIGMTSLPAVSPGEPICNLGKLPKKYKPSELLQLRSDKGGLDQRVLEELGSSVLVVDPVEETE